MRGKKSSRDEYTDRDDESGLPDVHKTDDGKNSDERNTESK